MTTKRISPRWAVLPVVLCCCLGDAGRALADDVADEADLHFRVGTERYQRQDFQGALEHFLLSNRLAPNRNVVFNIARAYEQLRQFPSAFRYYRQALEAEPDGAAKEKIEAALARIGPQVAVLDIVSEPPGATVYVDRRDLGAYGSAPRSLAFSPGKHKVILELDGYEPIETDWMQLDAGGQTPVRVALQRILGSVQVEATPAGAAVRTQAESDAPACAAPCKVSLPPGRQRLSLQRDGFERLTVEVDVLPKQTITVRPVLRPLTGDLVVNTDVRDAFVELDGRPMGFTPTVVQAPVGTRRLRVSRPGFEPHERVIQVRYKERTPLDVELLQLESVAAASRVTELVRDAPGSVTVVPSMTLRAMAFPTLKEALRGVRGLYGTDDRAYATVGFRGLSRLGDYGNRVLVLLDGHPVNDNWIGSSYVGYDFRTDLEDVDRIEVVRGAGSVVYGTNAFSGVLNVVTHGRDRPTGGSVGVSTNEYGVARARGMAYLRLAENAGMWTSVSGARAQGRDYYFPEYAQAPTLFSAGSDGTARGVDGFDAGTVHGGAWWGPVSASWFLHQRDKHVPTGAYDTVFGDARTRLTDRRGYLEARVEPKLSDAVELMLRASLDFYRYEGRYAYPTSEGGMAYERYRGAWAGGEGRIVLRPLDGVRLTAGGEGQNHFQVQQLGQDEQGRYLDQDDTYKVAAGYLVADVDPVRPIHLSAGARLDSYSTFGSSVSPRVALIVHPYEGGNVKLMAGKAFRAPSIYELYYSDGGRTQVQSKDLKPETIWSPELEFSHRFSPTWTGLVTGYGNYVEGLVVSRGDASQASPSHFVNSESAVVVLGGEAELRREWRRGWMLSASYSYQRASYAQSNDPGAARLREVPNSPHHLASLQGAVPLGGIGLTAASRLTIEGPRYDRYDQEGDPPQGRTDWFAVWDVVFSGSDERSGVRYAAGVYNAFDWRYSLPVSAELRQRVVVQSGRTFLLSLAADF